MGFNVAPEATWPDQAGHMQALDRVCMFMIGNMKCLSLRSSPFCNPCALLFSVNAALSSFPFLCVVRFILPLSFLLLFFLSLCFFPFPFPPFSSSSYLRNECFGVLLWVKNCFVES